MTVYLGNQEVGAGFVQNQDSAILTLKPNGAYKLTVTRS